MRIKLTLPTVFLLMILFLVGCAGIHSENTAKYDVFPFRNPSYQNRDFAGVGMRFTNAFTATCLEHSLDVTVVQNDQFDSSRDTSVEDALVYAAENGADYIIYGYVTKWSNKPTLLTSERDFAGLSVFVRSVESGEIVFSSEIQAFGIRYSSPGSIVSRMGSDYAGARVDIVQSLSIEMAEKFLSTMYGS